MGVTYRWYDFVNEGTDPRLFDLFAATYGDAEPLKVRWKWQYEQHPQKADIKMVFVEDGDRLIGMTSFIPIFLVVEGKTVPAWHGATAMVMKEYRRQGISTVMTQMFADELDVLIGKGVDPRQFAVILKFGWKQIKPDNNLVKVLSKPKWILRKTRLYSRAGKFLKPGGGFDEDFEVVERFGGEFDEFWQEVAPHYPAIVAKNSAYMNWRYIDIPIKKYFCIYRKENGRVKSVIILRDMKHLGNVVDMIWNPQDEREPDDTVRFTARYLKKSGFTNSYCFATLKSFRDSLRKHGYMYIKDSPLLAVYGEPEFMARMADGHLTHFVNGDSDHEFL